MSTSASESETGVDASGAAAKAGVGQAGSCVLSPQEARSSTGENPAVGIEILVQ